MTLASTGEKYHYILFYLNIYIYKLAVGAKKVRVAQQTHSSQDYSSSQSFVLFFC